VLAKVREQERRLDWEACYNARDLGGLPIAGGGETRWGAIVRADTLSRLSPAGQAALRDHGIRTILDLRLGRETLLDPSPFGDDEDIRYRHLPFVPDDEPPLDPEPATFEEDYIGMMERFRAQVGAIMKAIAAAPEGGIVIHCMGGKDRTGLICALLLDLVGVPRDVIGADYALSQDNLRPVELDWLENGPGTREWREREISKRPRATVKTIPTVLDYLDRTYGGTELYLMRTGLTPGEIAALRGRLVASP
jgi:protein-tyrosine phosphatase